MTSRRGQRDAVGTRSAAVPAAPLQSMRSRGRLPHWESENGVYFVTFRQSDSLPRAIAHEFEAEKRDIVATARQEQALSSTERRRLAKLFSARVETYLDSGVGACHLAKPQIARIVANALRYFDGQRYHLFAWCVMPNHVHVVVQPLRGHGLADILHSWKSHTAKEANQFLRRSGEFWQREYYDHLIRDGEEFARIIRYVAENPMRAGLPNWRWVAVCG